MNNTINRGMYHMSSTGMPRKEHVGLATTAVVLAEALQEIAALLDPN